MGDAGMICCLLNARGEELERVRPAALCLKRDADAPADSLELQAEGTFPAAARVQLWKDGVCLFAGLVDEQNTVYENQCVRTEWICRGFEAILLDNEALPGTVYNPSRAVLEQSQLGRFGLRAEGTADAVCRGSLTVTDGTSLYRAAQRFARCWGLADPHMPDVDVVSFAPRTFRVWELPVPKRLTACRRPYRRLRAVWYVPKESGRVTVYRNEAAEKDGAYRMHRQKDPTESPRAIADAAERMAFAAEGLWEGVWDIRPGDTLCFPFSGNLPQGLTADAVVCRLHAGVGSTRVVLRMPSLKEKQKEET